MGMNAVRRTMTTGTTHMVMKRTIITLEETRAILTTEQSTLIRTDPTSKQETMGASTPTDTDTSMDPTKKMKDTQRDTPMIIHIKKLRATITTVMMLK